MKDIKIYTKEEKIEYLNYLIEKIGNISNANNVIDELLKFSQSHPTDFDLKEIKKIIMENNKTTLLDSSIEERKIHVLKIHSEYYNAILMGNKTFEVRYNDRDYKLNDIIVLNEIDKHNGESTGRQQLVRNITYILQGGQFGIEKGYVVLSIA